MVKKAARKKTAKKKASKIMKKTVDAGIEDIFSPDGLKQVVKMMDSSSVREIELTDGDRSVFISKNDAVPEGINTPVYSAPPVSAPAPAQTAPRQSVPAQVSSNEEESDSSSKALIEIKSPIVGTFYEASSPEAGPFVKPGDSVKASTTVCIIEAMKVMNEIPAEVEGKINKVCAVNGEPVEYGQVLFLVEK